jgi:NADH:ubiquinone reductase (H+-translocating)
MQGLARIPQNKHRVVIIGGGFGGLHAAKELGSYDNVHVTLIDKRNFHLFQPLLYQVATGALSPANIASPLRSILRNKKNLNVLMAEVTDIDTDNRQVIVNTGVSVPYDTLIVAAGARTHYFGNDQWAEHAPSLKTIEDAVQIRRRVLSAFEQAEVETDPVKSREWLTFVVVGGGPTGVELAGAIGEIANHTLHGQYDNIDPSTAEIILVEGLDRVLNTYPPKLSDDACRSLTQLGVKIRLNTFVTNVGPESVTVKHNEQEETIRARTVLWGTGVVASPLSRILAERTGALRDRGERIIVANDCTLPGHPEIFVVGDMANYSHTPDGKPLPGVAQVAMQQGLYAARLIRTRLKGGTMKPFQYKNYGNMATIGRASAVADLGKVRFSGLIGWLAWLFIHILYLIEFENRILVMVQWAFSYFTRNRSARLITSEAENQPERASERIPA